MTLKKMLFVDDRTKRIHSALRQYADEYEVTIAANVKEALRAMAREDFDVISLDHDLTGCDFEDPDTPTCGMEIVRYIEKTGWPEEKPKPKFWVHSSNIFAAQLMVSRLRKMYLFAVWIKFKYDEPDPHLKYDEKGIPV